MYLSKRLHIFQSSFLCKFSGSYYRSLPFVPLLYFRLFYSRTSHFSPRSFYITWNGRKSGWFPSALYVVPLQTYVSLTISSTSGCAGCFTPTSASDHAHVSASRQTCPIAIFAGCCCRIYVFVSFTLVHFFTAYFLNNKKVGDKVVPHNAPHRLSLQAYINRTVCCARNVALAVAARSASCYAISLAAIILARVLTVIAARLFTGISASARARTRTT